MFWFKNEFRKKGLRSRLPKRNQKKGQEYEKKSRPTVGKLVQTKILEIETQEHLVLIFFAHFAQCLRFHEKYQLCAFDSENGQDNALLKKKLELENSETGKFSSLKKKVKVKTSDSGQDHKYVNEGLEI